MRKMAICLLFAVMFFFVSCPLSYEYKYNYCGYWFCYDKNYPDGVIFAGVCENFEMPDEDDYDGVFNVPEYIYGQKVVGVGTFGYSHESGTKYYIDDYYHYYSYPRYYTDPRKNAGGVISFPENTTRVILPDSVRVIKSLAFIGSNEIHIPKNVAEIESYAFSSICKTIFIYAENPPIVEWLFGDSGNKGSYLGEYYYYYERNNPIIPGNLKIYVPAESVNTYKTNEQWSKYSAYIFPMAE